MSAREGMNRENFPILVKVSVQICPEEGGVVEKKERKEGRKKKMRKRRNQREEKKVKKYEANIIQDESEKSQKIR